jgi:hypothetical protein
MTSWYRRNAVAGIGTTQNPTPRMSNFGRDAKSFNTGSAQSQRSKSAGNGGTAGFSRHGSDPRVVRSTAIASSIGKRAPMPPLIQYNAQGQEEGTTELSQLTSLSNDWVARSGGVTFQSHSNKERRRNDPPMTQETISQQSRASTASNELTSFQQYRQLYRVQQGASNPTRTVPTTPRASLAHSANHWFTDAVHRTPHDGTRRAASMLSRPLPSHQRHDDQPQFIRQKIGLAHGVQTNPMLLLHEHVARRAQPHVRDLSPDVGSTQTTGLGSMALSEHQQSVTVSRAASSTVSLTSTSVTAGDGTSKLLESAIQTQVQSLVKQNFDKMEKAFKAEQKAAHDSASQQIEEKTNKFILLAAEARSQHENYVGRLTQLGSEAIAKLEGSSKTLTKSMSRQIQKQFDGIQSFLQNFWAKATPSATTGTASEETSNAARIPKISTPPKANPVEAEIDEVFDLGPVKGGCNPLCRSSTRLHSNKRASIPSSRTPIAKTAKIVVTLPKRAPDIAEKKGRHGSSSKPSSRPNANAKGTVHKGKHKEECHSKSRSRVKAHKHSGSAVGKTRHGTKADSAPRALHSCVTPCAKSKVSPATPVPSKKHRADDAPKVSRKKRRTGFVVCKNFQSYCGDEKDGFL